MYGMKKYIPTTSITQNTKMQTMKTTISWSVNKYNAKQDKATKWFVFWNTGGDN
jgi:hypothetical protein